MRGKCLGIWLLIVIGILHVAGCAAPPQATEHASASSLGGEISLPAPRLEGEMSLEEAIANRRSVREFTEEPLSLEEISQLLWAAQGITDPRGLRAAPSAGAARRSWAPTPARPTAP